MFKASANIVLPTSIIGSLPRPHWYTAAWGVGHFLRQWSTRASANSTKTPSASFLRAQEVAGIDICTDGDAHYDEEVGGMSWQSYPIRHMSGFSEKARPASYGGGGARVSARPHPSRFCRSVVYCRGSSAR